MISPFETIGETIEKLKAISFCHQEYLKDPEYRQMEKPGWYKALLKNDNLELAEKFKEHLGVNGSSAGLYAEIVCGTSASKGCKECGFYFTPGGHDKKRCNFYGSCFPLVK